MYLSKGLRVKQVTYIVYRSSCWTYNQSVCHLLLEIIVCLNLEKDENGDIKGQNSAWKTIKEKEKMSVGNNLI